MPSTFTILLDALRIVRRHGGDLYGFAAWLLFPLLFYIAADASTSTTQTVLTAIGDIGLFILGAWAIGTIILTTAFAVAHPNKRPDPRAMSAHAWKAAGPLLLAQLITTILQLAGFVAFIVPGILATVWFAFTSQEIVLHGHSPFRALAASRERVRGKTWPVLQRLFGLAATLMLVLFLATLSITALVSVAYGPSWEAYSATNPPLWIDILANILQIAVMPVFFVAHTLLYLSFTKE